MATRITDKLVRSLETPTEGRRQAITFDDQISGFGVRVTAGGVRSFVLDYRAGGRQRRLTIGQYPSWSVEAARIEAKGLRRQIDQGQDPMGDRHVVREAPTVKDLWDRYEQDHLPKKRPSSQRDDRRMWSKNIAPRLGKMRVEDVRFRDVDGLHRDVSKTAPMVANRVVSLLSKMFNLAIRWDWRADNPAKGIERNSEESRERILSSEELKRLTAALNASANQQSANAVRLLILTGSRSGEVLSAKWDQFDLEAGAWKKPSAHTKQKKVHRIPLSAPARQLLSKMKEETSGEAYLFPAKWGRSPHQSSLKKFWEIVCKDAEIEGCRIHDLRHTFASLLASSGQSLALIGALLGHTQAATTKRYSHFYDDPLREAAERVGAIVAGDGEAEVVKIGKGREHG